MNVLRAPRVRFTSRTRWYFCSQSHADQFVPPVHNGTPSSSVTLSSDAESACPPPSSVALSSCGPSMPVTPTFASLASIPPSPHLRWPSSRPLGPEAPVAADDVSSEERALFPEVSKETSEEPVETQAWEEPPPVSALHEPRSSLIDSSEGHTFFALLLVVASAVAAMLEERAPWSFLASASLLAILLGLAKKLRQTVDGGASEYHQQIERLLREPARRINDEGAETLVSPDQLRSGEEIVVRCGEAVAADGTVSEGHAELSPWPEADVRRSSFVGMRVVAGARVLSGSIRLICTKTGRERAYAGVLGQTGVRVENETFAAKWARTMSVRGAPLAGLVLALAISSQGGGYADILGGLGTAWGAVASPLPRTLLGLVNRAWLSRAAKRGVLFLHEALLDRAGQVTASVFCVRGTVLHGEPEVAEIHSFRGVTEGEILAFAAGAESVVSHPIAAAITRAANARGVAVDVCRGHHAVPGRGVSCVSSSGETLIVGSREFLLDERVSIALAEETLRGLESRGLSALLIARDEHLVGVMALQDSLRAGARATVQLLLDEGIEPVLLSGESRATTEAVGHALSCEHVRPEVPGRHRALEVQRLRDAGAIVAVVGTTPRDEAALSAAWVPIILEGAAVSRRDSPHAHERAIGIASGSVLSSAVALAVARRIRQFGQTSLLVGYLPIVFALLGTLNQLAPLYFAPAAAVAASLVLTILSQRWAQRPLFPGSLSE